MTALLLIICCPTDVEQYQRSDSTSRRGLIRSVLSVARDMTIYCCIIKTILLKTAGESVATKFNGLVSSQLHCQLSQCHNLLFPNGAFAADAIATTTNDAVCEHS